MRNTLSVELQIEDEFDMSRTTEARLYRILGEETEIHLSFYQNHHTTGVVARHPMLNIWLSLPIERGWEEKIRTDMENIITHNRRQRRRISQKTQTSTPPPILIKNPDQEGEGAIMIAYLSI